MNMLPNDVILYIKDYLYDHEDLISLKITDKSLDKIITDFAVKKALLIDKFANYKPTFACVNMDCYWDTCDIFDDVYHAGYWRYIHSHQDALNYTEATINKKQYTLCSPYCSECFKKYVLIGDKQNVANNLVMHEVNIGY